MQNSDEQGNYYEETDADKAKRDMRLELATLVHDALYPDQEAMKDDKMTWPAKVWELADQIMEIKARKVECDRCFLKFEKEDLKLVVCEYGGAHLQCDDCAEATEKEAKTI